MVVYMLFMMVHHNLAEPQNGKYNYHFFKYLEHQCNKLCLWETQQKEN